MSSESKGNDEFKKAGENAKKVVSKVDDTAKLLMYGWYKQAVVGDVLSERPGMFDIKGKAKWDAWNSHKGTSSEDAQAEYVKLVNKLCDDNGIDRSSGEKFVPMTTTSSTSSTLAPPVKGKGAIFFSEPITEPDTGIELPASLENGDILCGAAKYAKKVGFLEINVYGVGFYVEASRASIELSEFKGKTIEELDCQEFYDKIINGNFRKSWKLIYNRGLYKSQLQNGYREQMPRYMPRTDIASNALEKFVSFFRDVEKGKSCVLTMNPNGILEVNFDGDEHQLDSIDMCNALLKSSFDNSPGKDAKYPVYRRLITQNFIKCLFHDTNSDNLSTSVEKDGILQKFQPNAIGLLRSTWLPRYVHVKDGVLKYWQRSGEGLTDSDAKRVWNISECIIREENEEVVKPKLGEQTMLLYCFSITNKKSGTVLKFGGEDPDLIEDWLKVLYETQIRQTESVVSFSQSNRNIKIQSRVSYNGLRNRRAHNLKKKQNKIENSRISKKMQDPNANAWLKMWSDLLVYPKDAVVLLLAISNLFLILALIFK